MKIKIKLDGQNISVDVANNSCQKYKCFYPHRWTTQSVNNNNTQTDRCFSCGTRNYHGCPDKPELKMITQEEYDQISILIRREYNSLIKNNYDCFVEDAPQLHFTDSPEELLQRINGDIPIAKERIKNRKEDIGIFAEVYNSGLAKFIIKKVPVKNKFKSVILENFLFVCKYTELDHDRLIVSFYLKLK